MINDLQRLFLEVADLDVASRSRYFEDHHVDRDLRREVEALLRFDAGSSDHLQNVVGATVERFLDSDPEKFCGPYELMRMLGEGGMGTVHLAQRKDGEVDLRVAVKLIRGAASPLVFRERFLRERQILASLSHPGITRLLDAGHTKSGQPYLVMEYVDGTPIDVYSRGLPLAAKLKLFLQVCDAIAYLHHHLVIHRDLKPSNILVEESGTPKVLDFGVAKFLDEAADGSVTRERILTPDYASPEQVKGTAKTTATDVYSLGAVLYHMLTGHSPHSPAGQESTEEAICSVTPISLHSLNPALPRDLNSVVQKALRKEPPERYATVDAFADDVRAILEWRPVKARAGDAWYKLRKFARRRWLPVSAVAAVIISLSVGLYAASHERSIAERRFAQIRQLANRLLTLDGEMSGLPGSTKAREHVVSVSMEYLDGLSREARSDLDLKLDAANGYMTTAEVQGVPIGPSLGHFQEAEKSLAKGAALVESVLAAAPSRTDALLIAAEIEQDRMIVADTQHDWDTSLAHAERGAGYLDRLTKIRSVSGDQVKRAARSYMRFGQGLMNIHRYDAATVEIRRGIELAKASDSPPDVVAQGLSVLANALRQAGDLDGALSSITEARALSERAVFPDEMMRASALYAILWRQGLILGEDESVSLNRPADALEPLQKAFDLVDQAASKDPNDFTFRDRVGHAGQQLGDVLRYSDPARALSIYDRSLARLREIKEGARARRAEARILAHSSYPLRSLHRMADARQRIEDAFHLLHSLGDEESSRGMMGGEWDNAMRAKADYEAATGHPDEARAILLDLHRELLAMHPSPETDLRHAHDMSSLYASIAEVDARLGNYQEASTFQARRTDLWRLWDRKLPGNSYIRRQLEMPSLNIPLSSAK